MATIFWGKSFKHVQLRHHSNNACNRIEGKTLKNIHVGDIT